MKIRVSPSGKTAFVGHMRIDKEQDVDYTSEVARKIKDGELLEVAKTNKVVEPPSQKPNGGGKGDKS